ncbi:hypothetical protein [Roseisolibacter agri]|uniref:hypothetical protein n=1 Tax=Roseisolibacter agri TaxID=2014610 RepID=UPI0024E1287B|nr:hypothetical protein [Roseisolibacter agri]
MSPLRRAARTILLLASALAAPGAVTGAQAPAAPASEPYPVRCGVTHLGHARAATSRSPRATSSAR